MDRRPSINTKNLNTRTPIGTDYECRSPEQATALIKSGVSPSRILFAEGARSARSLRFAARAGIENLVADEHEDLVKIACHHPRARVVLRVNTNQSFSTSPRDMDFDEATEVASDMLEDAASLGLNVAGVRFHVGSESGAYEIYTDSQHMSSPLSMRSPVFLRSPSYSTFPTSITSRVTVK